MFKRKPFPASLVALAILITLHSVGSYYSWYWTYSWFDSVVHIVSGLWVASVILWLTTYLGEINSLKEYKAKSFLIALVSALLLGVIWEILENLGRITFAQSPGYNLDTAIDLMSDAVGGILAYLYFIRRTRCTRETPLTLHPFYDQVGLTVKKV